MDIEGHWRGSVNQPGDKVPRGAGDYGQSTVMMENANDEVTSGTPDYTTNANAGHVDKAKDYDLVQVVLYWPKGAAVPGTLSLTGTGMQVDGSQAVLSGSSVKETGPSHINFYDKDGNLLDAGDFQINPASPDGSYMDQIVTTGSCVLYIEGGSKFGYEGSVVDSRGATTNGDGDPDGGNYMGGAVLKFQFASTSGTATQRLLVYRGGFLDFRVPDAPGTVGTLYFYDGKGRIDNKVGNPIHGNEFSTDKTDYGRQLYHWDVKSGKPGGKDYNIAMGAGHTPLGWWTQKEKDVPSNDLDQSSGSGQTLQIRQGAMCRWQQDDATDPAQRYATTYLYNASVDASKGLPNSLHFEFLMSPIPPCTLQNRSGIAIHPDGKCDGTLGCVGIQKWNDCNKAVYILRNYHGLKVKVEKQ